MLVITTYAWLFMVKEGMIRSLVVWVPRKSTNFGVAAEMTRSGWSTQSRENSISYLAKTSDMVTMATINSTELTVLINFGEIAILSATIVVPYKCMRLRAVMIGLPVTVVMI